MLGPRAALNVRACADMSAVEAYFWSQVWRCAHRHPCRTCCWPWRACFEEKRYYAYGSFTLPGDRQQSPAHRVALIFSKGALFLPFPPGNTQRRLVACHACDFPPCCNPSHVFLATHADNMRDARQKGFFKVDRYKPLVLPDGSLLVRDTPQPSQRLPNWGAYLKRVRAEELRHPTTRRHGALQVSADYLLGVGDAPA
jgi:hypothetical protein